MEIAREPAIGENVWVLRHLAIMYAAEGLMFRQLIDELGLGGDVATAEFPSRLTTTSSMGMPVLTIDCAPSHRSAASCWTASIKADPA